MMEHFPHGEFFVALRESDLVLDVNGASDDVGADIILYTQKDGDNANQRWTWDNENKSLRNVQSGHVLSFHAVAALTPARQDRLFEDAKTQRFEYYDYTISTHADEDLVLGAPSKELGAVVALVPRDNDDWNQMWEIRKY
ncbi:hypothetical protein DFQ27_007459 [Actinomortierella ambigua]|uniref:Ricin B lectin domain-containing protein n=1 Tax=Actinomortierella ambigua TaxID=1343610 RepID=A0A9P6UBX1_9FUNG|nr:hypothetical protein DFQ26_000916 [Actinomortierella ambigua]KAG0268116.1 hypothetical protein DFQ27_007459 [Actinomortierella ambigua]